MSNLDGFSLDEYRQGADERVQAARIKAEALGIGSRVLLMIAERVRDNSDFLNSAAGLIIPATTLKDRVKPGSVDGPREEALSHEELAEALELASIVIDHAMISERGQAKAAQDSLDWANPSGNDAAT